MTSVEKKIGRKKETVVFDIPIWSAMGGGDSVMNADLFF